MPELSSRLAIGLSGKSCPDTPAYIPSATIITNGAMNIIVGRINGAARYIANVKIQK
jgi:hypothetical protein